MADVPPLRWQHVVLVAAGGALGTSLREAVASVSPVVAGISIAILAVNLLGSFLLGALLSFLGRRPETEARRGARMFLGAGVLGGFTTYSAVALDTARVWSEDAALAGGYAVLSLLAGLAAAGLGLRAGAVRFRGNAAT